MLACHAPSSLIYPLRTLKLRPSAYPQTALTPSDLPSLLDEVKGIIGDGCYYPSKNIPMSLGAVAIAALLVFRAYCPGIRSSSSVVLLSRYLSW
ncbi:hypothetical protein Tco_1025382 [Tanacetum coccineum]